MSAHIDLEDISVFGVDTHARAATLRQWFSKASTLRTIKIPILQGVSFHAKPGDRIALIGANGSGKSSLLKVISGNYPIHKGTREVEGTIVPLIEMGAGFEGEISGRGNIKLTYAYRGRLRDYSKQNEEEIIAFSELGKKIDLPLKSYSSGMLARLAFSSAIFQSPDILLLDEVFATGDAGFHQKATKKLHERMDRAAITIIVAHNADSMLNICNRFVLMDQGRVINEGSSKDILAQYKKDILNLPPEAPLPQQEPYARNQLAH